MPRQELHKDPNLARNEKLVLILVALVVISCLLFYAVNSGESYASEVYETRAAQTFAETLLDFDPSVQHWGPWIEIYAQHNGINPLLLASIMQIESCGNPEARSNSGAIGLFQVLGSYFSVNENPTDPATNTKKAVWLLQDITSRQTDNLEAQLADYNGGYVAGAWFKGEKTRQDYINYLVGLGWGREQAESKADEVSRYVYWGTGLMDQNTRVATLEAWKTAGGISLCEEAFSSLKNDNTTASN